MFKKKMTYYVEEADALDFCESLCKEGLKFTMSGLRGYTDNSGRQKPVREFTVYAPRRKVKSLESKFKR